MTWASMSALQCASWTDWDEFESSQMLATAQVVPHAARAGATGELRHVSYPRGQQGHISGVFLSTSAVSICFDDGSGLLLHVSRTEVIRTVSIA